MKESIKKRIKRHVILAYVAFGLTIPAFIGCVFLFMFSEHVVNRYFHALYEELQSVVDSQSSQLSMTTPILEMLSESEDLSTEERDFFFQKVFEIEDQIQTLQKGLNRFTIDVSELTNRSGWAGMASSTIAKVGSILILVFMVGTLLNFYKQNIAIAAHESTKLDILEYIENRDVSPDLFIEFLVKNHSLDVGYVVAKSPIEQILELVERASKKS